MNIYTYFDQCCVSDSARHALELWKQSWQKNGWTPMVLTEDDARSHPFHSVFSETVRAFPSVNGSGFDYHAFMRWLAVANLNSRFVVTTEPDVINYSLVPDDVDKFTVGLDLHSPVPAFVVGASLEFERFCAHVMAHRITPEDHFEGRPHLSDQDFAARYAGPRDVIRFIDKSPWCAEAFSDGWQQAPCVHFGTPYMLARSLMPKHEHIPVLRPLP